MKGPGGASLSWEALPWKQAHPPSPAGVSSQAHLRGAHAACSSLEDPVLGAHQHTVLLEGPASPLHALGSLRAGMSSSAPRLPAAALIPKVCFSVLSERKRMWGQSPRAHRAP